MRNPLAILNELSLPQPGDYTTAIEFEPVLQEFLEVLRQARAIRSDLALASQVGLAATPVTAAYQPLAAFVQQRGGRMLELWRLAQAMRNHAPFALAPGLRLADQGEEYRHGGDVCHGLGLAAANAQIAVSFLRDAWDREEIEVERVWLEEEGDDVVERSVLERTNHASRSRHVRTHAEFIRRLALPAVISGADLWRDRAHQYPHLTFLPQVEAQLSALTSLGNGLRGVDERLAELEASAAAWNPTESRFPPWGSLVTPEGEQRKSLCYFRDLDGEMRCFDLHARYTPDHGRIHFRLATDGAGGHLVIAYIGRKLE